MWQSNTNNAVCCFDSSILHCHSLVDASMGSTNSTTLNTIIRHLQGTVLKPRSTYCDYYGSMPFEIRNIILAYLDFAAITHLPCNLGSVRFLITLFNSHIQLLWLLFFFYIWKEKSCCSVVSCADYTAEIPKWKFCVSLFLLLKETMLFLQVPQIKCLPQSMQYFSSPWQHHDVIKAWHPWVYFADIIFHLNLS